MACRQLVVPLQLQRRPDLAADRLRLPAARVERASGRRIDGAGHVTGEDDALARRLQLRVWNRAGREQRNGVRMLWVVVDILTLAQLHDLPKVHDGHAV